MAQSIDLGSRRLLIFVVAYNAETTIAGVLSRIPACLHTPNVEVLVIDDFSEDKTFSAGVACERAEGSYHITMLRTPENQGYGGNQKLGYRYAIDHGFDIVALLHGDGQYAPEKLPELLTPFLRDGTDAVLGSRMLEKGAALRGGMPFHKWLGNKVLTRFQNRLLGMNLSEFHSGYRLYSVNVLRQIPFERNSNGFHFDTEIIVQLLMRKLRIVELPIPTYYGTEICHVNGIKYAWDVCRTVLRARFHAMELFYSRKFDVRDSGELYAAKLGYPSSHTMAIEAVQPGATVLDIGCGGGSIAAAMAKRARHVTGIDRDVPREPAAANVDFIQWDLDSGLFPFDLTRYDQVFMLDIIEHLKDPEAFLEIIRNATGGHRPEVILTVPNIGFFITRFMLLLGQFHYGKRGILDCTHTRLFTFGMLLELLDQSGYKTIEIKGVPAPYPKAIGHNIISRALIALNLFLLRFSKGLFAYQIFVKTKAMPTIEHLLRETIDKSNALKKTAGERGAASLNRNFN